MDRILFVDDELVYVADYIEALRTKKFRVDFCETAEESVRRMIDNEPYDLVVLDDQMPPPVGLSPSATNWGRDTGLWALGQAKERILSQATPVVILTNRKLEDVRSAVQKRGLPEVEMKILSKPDTPYEKLPEEIYRLLPRFTHCEATLLRYWDEQSAAVAVKDEHVGWLEFDVPARALPEGIQVGNRLPVGLKIDRHGDVLSYQIRADAGFLPQSGESVGEKLTADIPKPPATLDDPEAMANYRRDLAEWARSAGLH